MSAPSQPSGSAPTPQMAQVVAFYLPQFHPIPENDEWWGPGFTEWTNVAGARRLYPTHEQPRIPGELGFYDLRLAETREAQANLARAYGVSAFCYWHYWFGNGRRLLERPFDEVLDSGQPDFPFCLGWANQTWTGIWHGSEDRVLIDQEYPGGDDDLEHFSYLCRAFADPRYLRIAGRPLFYIYQPQSVPNVAEFLANLRSFCIGQGVGDPWVLAECRSTTWLPSEHGFDGGVCVSLRPEWVRRARAGGSRWNLRSAQRRLRKLTMRLGLPEVYSYESLATSFAWTFDEFGFDEVSFPAAIPGWDNTPRSSRAGLVYHRPTPEAFEKQVSFGLQLLDGRPPEQRLLFVKSWNEWAEGNYLEPDRSVGRSRLEALRDALNRDVLRRLDEHATTDPF